MSQKRAFPKGAARSHPVAVLLIPLAVVNLGRFARVAVLVVVVRRENQARLARELLLVPDIRVSDPEIIPPILGETLDFPSAS